jgi:hypothetical protein
MYLKDISEDNFQIKKRKTLATTLNHTPLIITPNPDMEFFDSCELDLAFRNAYSIKKRKAKEIQKISSSISKPSRNANIYYTKYENKLSSIYKPNLL